MRRRILVTGAAGFIGSHVSEALLRRGDRVVAVDAFDDYYDPLRKRSNLHEIAQAGGALEFVEGDIRDDRVLGELFRHGLDAVVHLAGLGGVRASVERPLEYQDVNVGGTVALLEAVRRHDKPNFVFASTSSVYGASTEIPFLESDRCDRPLAPYPASKRSAELLGHAYHHLHQLNFTALRFFTVYGPRGRPDMMPYKLLRSVMHREEIPLYGEGTMRRDWTYVGDIAQGILRALDRPLGYEVINLGRGAPELLSDFIVTVESATGREAVLRPEPAHPADVPVTYANIDKARQLLDYEPQVDIQQGVRELVAWYKRVVLD
ncbi:MAG: NAD-dependent epimerase/dehydratase family protein [Myxococcota bacterium]